MYLKKIILNNYRCFKDFEIDLHPRLTVLVGKNGSGKTAILDAIATGISPLFGYLSTANQRLSGPGFKDTDFRIESWVGANGKERWSTTDFAQVIIKTTEGLEWDYWRPSAAGKQPATKIGRSLLSAYATSILESLKTVTPKPLPIFVYYGTQRGRIEIPEHLRPTKQDYNQPTSALADSLNAQSDFKEMLKWFDEEESAELRANKNFKPEDGEPSFSLNTVRNAIEEIFDNEYSNPHFNKDHKFVVSQENGMPLQVSQLSQGYQSMLSLVMDFARRLAIGNNDLRFENIDRFNGLISKELPNTFYAPALLAPAVMLVDEIDLHLHPSWQQRVLKDLMRTFPNTQFIVTTHSPQVLSTIHKDSIRLLGKDSNEKDVAAMPIAESYGEISSDVLESIMHVNPMPPIAERESLERLTELVDQGLYADREAIEILEKLRSVFGETHPQLQKLMRNITRQKTFRS